MGLHLPAAAPYVAEALLTSATTSRRSLAHHGYWPLGLARPAQGDRLAPDPLRRPFAARGDPRDARRPGSDRAGGGLFLGPGRTVILEDPTYVGAIDVFAAAGARLVSVPVGELGIRLDLLREALTREAPSLIYLMPTFQNPTGVVMPESHRREIARMAAERGVPILEDDALANLDLGQRPPPPISSFAPSAPILSAGRSPSSCGAACARDGSALPSRSSRAWPAARPWAIWATPSSARCSPRACLPGPRRSATPAAGRSPSVSASWRRRWRASCRTGPGGARAAASRSGCACRAATPRSSPAPRSGTASRSCRARPARRPTAAPSS